MLLYGQSLKEDEPRLCVIAGALVESSNQGEVLILLFCYLGAKHPTC